MRVLFLGNHTVGVTALEALRQTTDVVGVVAHPPDPEDGVRYLSLHDAAVAAGLPVLRGKGRDPAVLDFARSVAPDLLWVTDYRYLLPADLIALASRGAVNLHPSLLPRYRGRAPINWAILNGERRIGLTAHFIAEGVDTGDIIEQIPLELDETEDVGDALRKLLPLYDALTRRVATALRTGPVEGRPQDPALATEYPRRTPEDGRIDWKRSALQVRDLVRAVAAPYPGAFTDLPDGRRLFIWKAAVEQAEGRLGPAGTILSATGDRSFLVSCGAGSVRVLSWSATPGAAFSPRAGTVLP